MRRSRGSFGYRLTVLLGLQDLYEAHRAHGHLLHQGTPVLDDVVKTGELSILGRLPVVLTTDLGMTPPHSANTQSMTLTTSSREWSATSAIALVNHLVSLFSPTESWDFHHVPDVPGSSQPAQGRGSSPPATRPARIDPADWGKDPEFRVATGGKGSEGMSREIQDVPESVHHVSHLRGGTALPLLRSPQATARE